MLLSISVLALLAGTLAHRLARAHPTPLAVADGFVVISACGLVLVHILPDAFRDGSWAAIVMAGIGVVFPYLLERRRPLKQAPPLLMVLAIAGLTVHLFLDGAALAADDHTHGESLSLAVLLHRFPVGVSLWLFARPASRGADVLRLIGIVLLATVIGSVFGGAVLSRVPTSVIAMFQAFVAGSLLHIVLETTNPSEKIKKPLGSAIGGLIGVVVVVSLARTHSEFFTALLSLAYATAPWLLLGYFLASVAHALLPRRWRHALRGNVRALDPWRGTLFGLFRPVTMCAAPDAYHSLHERGVRVGANIPLFIVVGTLAIPAIAISVPLLGGTFTWIRVVAALGVALVAGYLFLFVKSHATSTAVAEHDVKERFVDGLSFGFGELVSHTAPWVLVGLVLAAMVEPMFDPDALRQLSPNAQVPLASLAALPFYVCATGGTPLVAMLIHKGLSPGAGLVLLICGPLLSTQILFVLKRLHGVRMVAAYAAIIVGLSILAGFVVNLTFTHAQTLNLLDTEPNWWHRVSAAGIVGLFLLTYLRQGPRRFLELAFAPHGHAHHAGELHEHG